MRVVTIHFTLQSEDLIAFSEHERALVEACSPKANSTDLPVAVAFVVVASLAAYTTTKAPLLWSFGVRTTLDCHHAILATSSAPPPGGAAPSWWQQPVFIGRPSNQCPT